MLFSLEGGENFFEIYVQTCEKRFLNKDVKASHFKLDDPAVSNLISKFNTLIYRDILFLVFIVNLGHILGTHSFDF